MDDIDNTAVGYFLAKIANGGLPETVAGGELDGLAYFAVELDGSEYWLTAEGLFHPPAGAHGPEGWGLAEEGSTL